MDRLSELRLRCRWLGSFYIVHLRSSGTKPDSDVLICNSHLVEGLDDAQGVVSLAMYPKQPFDFAGRTGKVVLVVSDESQGSNAACPEF